MAGVDDGVINVFVDTSEEENDIDMIAGDVVIPPTYVPPAVNVANADKTSGPGFKFVFMHRIIIENSSEHHLQVLGRHWTRIQIK